MSKTKIAIFASGRGSNAAVIIDNSKQLNYEVALVFSNKPDAHVLEMARLRNIPTHSLTKEAFSESSAVLPFLAAHNVEFIVLAGFLWLIPNFLIEAFPNRILNVHPSLLPKYGGKGMYGLNVHQAVYDHGEVETGITIHLVNEQYDKGAILYQEKIPLETQDTPKEIAQKVLQLEHMRYSDVISEYIKAFAQ